MTTHLYGIPNCDSVAKARKWLDAKAIEYTFHDYKKEGADPARLEAWIAAHGLDIVLNKRGTTWRKLSDEEKADAADSRDNCKGAVALLVQHPSMIKRPVVEHNGASLVGFKEDQWSALFF